MCYDSKKWDKWMLHNSKASDFDRSIIAGHYVFSNPEVLELKKEATLELEKKCINLEAYLKQQVKLSILRYLRNFRLVRV